MSQPVPLEILDEILVETFFTIRDALKRCRLSGQLLANRLVEVWREQESVWVLSYTPDERGKPSDWQAIKVGDERPHDARAADQLVARRDEIKVKASFRGRNIILIHQSLEHLEGRVKEPLKYKARIVRDGNVDVVILSDRSASGRVRGSEGLPAFEVEFALDSVEPTRSQAVC